MAEGIPAAVAAATAEGASSELEAERAEAEGASSELEAELEPERASSEPEAERASSEPEVDEVELRDRLLIGLTFSSGAVDAICYLTLGKVFTAFMTGNFVFLGLRIAGAAGPNLVSVAVSLVVFSAGVFLATRSSGRRGARRFGPAV